MTRSRILGLLLTLSLVGCVAGEDTAKQEAALSVDGPWVIPAETSAIGDMQYVPYTSAGPWVGESGCGGSLLGGTQVLREWLDEAFPQITHLGGYSCRHINGDSSQMSVHATGRALDIHIPLHGGEADNDLGDPVAAWLVEHAEEVGIQYLIWDRWTWSASRSAGSKDRAYGGAHPHHDHLHVELSVDGGAMRTPWFSGEMEPPAVASCGVVPAAGGVIDDSDECFTAFGPATYWRTETMGHDGSLHWTNAFESDSPSNWARWYVELEEPGEYVVEVYLDPAFAAHQQTRYGILHGDETTELLVDQSAASGWLTLGTYRFEAGAGQHVSVHDNSPVAVAADQHVVADALRLTPAAMAPPTTPEVPGAVRVLDPAPIGVHGHSFAPIDGGDAMLDDDPLEPFDSAMGVSGGCSVGGAPGASGAGLFALGFALLVGRRRRRS